MCICTGTNRQVRVCMLAQGLGLSWHGPIQTQDNIFKRLSFAIAAPNKKSGNDNKINPLNQFSSINSNYRKQKIE